MLQHIPKGLPSFSMLMDGIGKPHPSSLAKALGVDVRTVYRWMADDQAPRCPSLAMYWLTPWGLSRLDAELVNTARLHMALYQAAQAANRHQAHELARAQALASFHSRHAPAAANDHGNAAAKASTAMPWAIPELWKPTPAPVGLASSST